MTKKKTHETFVKEVFELVGKEYAVLSQYQTTHTKIKMRHNTCKHEYDVAPSKFLTGKRCPKCFGNIKKTTNGFKEEVYSLVGDEYEVLGEYINTMTKILMKHNKCSHEWYISPDNFIQGKRCPRCKFSRGESKIDKWLKQNYIKKESQFSFDDCRNIHPLPFDFAVFNNESSLIYLIEYDGEGHFEPFRFSKDKSVNIRKFKNVQLRDQIKNQYCQDNDIPLIRIPYWEFDRIEEILKHYLIEPIDNFEGSFLVS